MAVRGTAVGLLAVYVFLFAGCANDAGAPQSTSTPPPMAALPKPVQTFPASIKAPSVKHNVVGPVRLASQTFDTSYGKHITMLNARVVYKKHQFSVTNFDTFPWQNALLQVDLTYSIKVGTVAPGQTVTENGSDFANEVDASEIFNPDSQRVTDFMLACDLGDPVVDDHTGTWIGDVPNRHGIIPRNDRETVHFITQ